ncbi:MAG: hypothetical protein ACREIA_20615 [Opitutaceae bacterium]
MKRTPYKEPKDKAGELEPFDKRKVNFAKFKPDLSPKQLASAFKLPGIRADLLPVFFFPIETLSVTKTIGKGRTNLTFIRPTIVQTDATAPYAGFDIQLSPSRNPVIQMHFEPGAYGITSVSSYVMVFEVECFGQSNFNLSGFAGAGTLTNAGARVLNGKLTVSLGFRNVPPNHEIYGYLEQTSGVAWNFYSVRVRFPYPVIVAV